MLSRDVLHRLSCVQLPEKNYQSMCNLLPSLYDEGSIVRGEERQAS